MHCVDVNDFLAAVVEAEKNGTRPILNGAELPGKNDIRLITGGACRIYVPLTPNRN